VLLLLALLLSISPAPIVALESNESGRLVTVGAHKIFLNCTGDASGPTVVLEAGTGDTSEVPAQNETKETVRKAKKLV
jgi:hypothetical protein